ncbi:energy-coupling factor transporter transmembrane protein EcfT [Cellulosilyticum ruminicola]|uniref:energy-coupling factor transporter transmembrane protein EcfT n=1 Tax=Cellulosilyticum ruminicola TaxID=425254 RepID=UPI001FA7CF67|nr:energy-coupling factor transporter transmembrane protein EcfT [Cellulosilyticum ruminicola]
MRGFKMYHPLINFIYFVSVMSFAMFLMHPICLILALISSLMYIIKLKGIKHVLKNACFMLPILIGTALINPAFNHKGATILYYFKSGNPLTLESIAYGLAAATMLVTVMNLFMAYTEVVTSDKLIYLFGRLLLPFLLSYL